jgi:hypothetical protein
VKFITWVKSLGLVVVLAAVGAAIMMVLRAFAAGKMEAEVAQQETRIEELRAGTAVDIQAAATLQRGIAAKKIRARAIRKKAERHQERIGENETMADIATRFNNKRVRSRADTATELRNG